MTSEIIYVGPIGTRQCDLDKLIRRPQSKARQLVFAYEAGPCWAAYRLLGFVATILALPYSPCFIRSLSA